MNASTGFSGFQLRMGQSPRILPLLVPSTLARPPAKDINACAIISNVLANEAEAKDALLTSKISQVFWVNKDRGMEDIFKSGDQVMLSTLHWRREYKAGDTRRIAKFFPHFDGPHSMIGSFPEKSAYTLHLPNSPETFNMFHSSILKWFHLNDPILFPSHEHACPSSIVTAEGVEEYAVEKIVNERKHGGGFQYLVRWVGYGPDEDLWLLWRELDDCKALDEWLAHRV